MSAAAERWSTVGLPALALAVVVTSMLAPITALVGGPTLLVASVVAFRQAETPTLRGIALITGTAGAAVTILVLVVLLGFVATGGSSSTAGPQVVD